jgi:hypothetical protein
MDQNLWKTLPWNFCNPNNWRVDFERVSFELLLNSQPTQDQSPTKQAFVEDQKQYYNNYSFKLGLLL